jgi:hypothetical protein
MFFSLFSGGLSLCWRWTRLFEFIVHLGLRIGVGGGDDSHGCGRPSGMDKLTDLV